MKDYRDNKHEKAKAKKFGGVENSSKKHSQQCDCGAKISDREAAQNDGLCHRCLTNPQNPR